MGEEDIVFRWRCPHCGKLLEDGRQDGLELQVYSHLKKCGGSSDSLSKEDPYSGPLKPLEPRHRSRRLKRKP